MKKLLALLAILPLIACSKGNDGHKGGGFDTFDYPMITFRNDAMGTSGGTTFARLVPEPEAFIKQHVLDVAKTLYNSASDRNIPTVNSITFIIDPAYTGVAQKEDIDATNFIIRYSPGNIEQALLNTDAKKLAEIGGVLNHELTHIYQLQPKGAGVYDGASQYWAFIEGVADAVRPLLGPYADGRGAEPGGTYMSGYRITGWFLVWLKNTKDADFLRKFNATAATVNPWSWDKAMQSIFGASATTESLWSEYQASFGD